MQIGKNVYVDLEIEDLQVKDFLKVGDLVDLQIIESAGTSLPVLYMSFFTYNKDIANYFIRNNIIKVKLGTSAENCDTFIVSIYTSAPPNNGAEGARSLVEFAGFTASQEYMVNFESKTYWGNSLLVALRVLYNHLGAKPPIGVITDITRTNENQVRWRQNNTSACMFLAETLLHMDIMPSFPLFGFDKYGTFHLRDYNKVAKEGATTKFVLGKAQSSDEIVYMNNFSITDYTDSYNLYSGFNKITEILETSKGVSNYIKSFNEPVLASTKETDKLQGSSRERMNVVQSANVHNTYATAFTYNTNKLMALSSKQGVLQLVGDYYKRLKPTDIVMVSNRDNDPSIEGLYIIDTIVTKVEVGNGGLIHTYVYVTRDNKNNVENYVANPKRGIKIKSQFLTDLMNAISSLRVAYAFGQQVIDGRYMKRLMSFAINTKQNLLRSFNVAGVPIDFNSSAALLRSITCVGNSLMNTLVSMILPEQLAFTFKDFIIRKPTLRGLLSKYIDTYVPLEIRSIVVKVVDSLFHTTNSLNSIAKDNGISVLATGSGTTPAQQVVSGEETIAGERVENEVPDTSEQDYMQDGQDKVQQIISDFENNTSGLNIPFPIVNLTESMALMSDGELKKYIADQTVQNLTNLGYLEGVDVDKFEEILLGEEPVDFNMIERINKNAGSTLSYRYWGTFEELSDLTEFYIKKCFKDRFRTIPCTKLINATGNQKFFFACPSSEQDLRFYINSKRVDVIETLYDKVDEYMNKEVLGFFPIKLGYYDLYGTPVPYTVYYTNIGYNSNSVLFEVKQGGMV